MSFYIIVGKQDRPQTKVQAHSPLCPFLSSHIPRIICTWCSLCWECVSPHSLSTWHILTRKPFFETPHCPASLAPPCVPTPNLGHILMNQSQTHCPPLERVNVMGWDSPYSFVVTSLTAVSHCIFQILVLISHVVCGNYLTPVYPYSSPKLER